MSAAALIKIAAWKMGMWCGLRLAAPRKASFSFLGARFAALIHTPHGATLVMGIAMVVLVVALRSAWFDIHGRWRGI